MEYQNNPPTGEELKIFKNERFTIYVNYDKGNSNIAFTRLDLETVTGCRLDFNSEKEAKTWFDGINTDLQVEASWNAFDLHDYQKIES